MTKFVAVVGIAAVLAGCQHDTVFVKAGSTRQDFAADKLACLQLSNGSVGSTFTGRGPLTVAIAQAGINRQQQDFFNTCMEAKSWEQEAH